jgi:polysaccharide deacetylase 2 family uncharacterized protein YibQ
MKFISKLLPKFSSIKLWLSKLSIIVTIALGLAFFSLVISKLFLGQDARIEAALSSGQRLEIDLGTNEIKGKIVSSKKTDATQAAATTTSTDATASTDVAANPTDATSPVPEDATLSAGAVAATPVTEENKAPSDLAWTKTDFIGPPLPQDVLDAFIQDGSGTTLEAKKVSVKELGDKPVIVVIVKGLGLSSSTTEDAIDLPKDVTLGFSPYSPSIEKWVEKAKASGHEFILNIPMETKDFEINDPGPYALITKVEKEENITRLKMLLSLVKGYEAVYSENEEVFTHVVNSVKPVLESLKQQRKYFIYGGGYSDFSLIQVAESMAYPILVNDALLDDEISEDAINKKLAEVESIAKTRGYAVVMTHPYPITIRMLERWLPEADKRGFRFAPVSLLLGKDFIDK